MLIALLLGVALHAVFRRSGERALMSADFLAAALIAFALLHAIAAEPIFSVGLPATAYLMGFRDAVFFIFVYFVGRGAAGHVGLLVSRGHLVVIAVVTSLVAIVERIVVTPDMLVGLGVASYFQEFLGVAEFTAGNEYGLPMNYWTDVGGVVIQRAGSVFLSGQGFAVPFLLLFPAVLVWALDRSDRRPRHYAAVALAFTGLLLTITRATIIVALIQVILYVTVKKRPEWAVLGLVAAASAILITIVAFPSFGVFLWRTLTWQEASAASHAAAWSSGVEAFFQRPWGWGLGTTDQTAVRAGLTPITGDNLYLKYAVEMGVIGLGLLVALLFTLAATGYRLLSRARTANHRRLGLIVFLTTAGIAINGIPAAVFNSVPLAWLYFLVSGAAVTVWRDTAGENTGAFATARSP